MPDSLIEQMEAARRKRIASLTRAIKDHGFEAAVEYAQSALEGSEEAFTNLRLTVAIALVDLTPADTSIYESYQLNRLLRQYCAESIFKGDILNEKLRAFAARSILEAPPSRQRGRPKSKWQHMIACEILRNLKEAKVPVYHGDGTSADAPFYGVDAVAEAMGIDERTLRDWWQKRHEVWGT